MKYVNPLTGVAFVACGRDYYRMVWSAITFIRRFKKRLCMCRVLHVGGNQTGIDIIPREARLINLSG